MKTLLASLLALLITQHFTNAQTLRWTQTLTAPAGIDNSRVTAGVPITDALGNLGVVIQFKDTLGNLTGFRILWLAASRGKVLMSADTAASNPSEVPTLLRISGSYLLTQFPGSGTNQILRRFRYLRGGTVQSDLAIDTATERLQQENSDAYINRDIAGFYVFTSTPAGSLTAIKRYTVR